SAIRAEVQQRLGTAELRFHAGISYRHLMVWAGGPLEVELTPPHDISDRPIAAYLPRGARSDTLLGLMISSHEFLPAHPVNQARVGRGLRPANSLWFWGQGKRPSLPLFADKYGVRGSVICAVDLTKGLGICAGLTPVEVPGATGNITTDFRGKARAALSELHRGQDFVYLHVEAPDEAGHRGELETKIRAIEEIDAKVVGELLAGLADFDDFRMMVLPDHPTPLSVRTHTAEEVPFVIYQASRTRASGLERYDEESGRRSGLRVDPGYLLMDRFMGLQQE
ncbi:MAG: phosphoglycerate mutase, partial [Syntrophomonadaceae bacterium]|nr:phosphoglycerate mutase [Syntrophomonadaceae bacterium]